MSFVPFDLRQLRCIIYTNSPNGLSNLQRELVATFSVFLRDVIRFRVREGETADLDERLLGKENSLFGISIECVSAGRDAVKLYVHFSEVSIDERPPVGFQFLVLGENCRSAAVENIPWQLHLIDLDGQSALVQLERLNVGISALP